MGSPPWFSPFRTPQSHPRGLKVKSISWVLHIQALNGRGSQGVLDSCEPLGGSFGSILNPGSHSGREPGRNSDGGGVYLGCQTRLTLDRAHSPSMPEPLAGGEGQETPGALGIWLGFHFQGSKRFPGQTWDGQRAEAGGQEAEPCCI